MPNPPEAVEGRMKCQVCKTRKAGRWVGFSLEGTLYKAPFCKRCLAELRKTRRDFVTFAIRGADHAEYERAD